MNTLELTTIFLIIVAYLSYNRAYPNYYVLNVFEGDDCKKIYCKGYKELYERILYYESKDGIKTNYKVIGKRNYISGKKKS